jgi:apolipoprotein N-acyltransferase
MSWIKAPLYGLYFGVLSYALFNYWLASFHPLTIFIIPLLYAFYYLILFPVMKLAIILFPRRNYLLLAVIWVAYEYLRTKGFLGYSYGVIGYSQYLITPLVRLSSLTGVWGVSFLVVLPSSFIGFVIAREKVGLSGFFMKYRKNIAIFLIILTTVFIWGTVSRVDYSSSEIWKVAMIQQNIDPWQGGIKTYAESLKRLIRQSDKALKENPDIVVWSETSFVPAIEWHTKYRTDHETFKLVKKLKNYLAEQDTPFVIGNDDGQLGSDEEGNLKRIDYNATLLFEGGELTERYRKTHLVPFTEHFPYKNQLPWMYSLLEKFDTHFWEKGNKYTVFENRGIKFSTPVCFEDTFGYLSRKFINRGADVIVNMTNDSWSGSVASEVQHMMHAVFRAAENRRSVIRSTNGGITCVIDPNGKIIGRIDPFVESYLIADVPVYKRSGTVYTAYGDWFGVLSLIISLIFLAVGLIISAKKKGK